MPDTRLSTRVESAAGGPWVVLCNAVGVPHAIFDRLVATLAGEFRVLCWATPLTERDEPHGRPVRLAVDEQLAEVTGVLRGLGIREFTGVSWCSGTEVLYRLSRGGEFGVRGHCCVNGAFNLGPDGPSSPWEAAVEPIFRLICTRDDVLAGAAALLQSAAAAATEGGDPALAFPYSTPERLTGYAAQCLAMRHGRTARGFVESADVGLYLSGSADAVQPPAVSLRAAELAGSRFELIEGGGHAMMADAQPVCDRLREYCEAVSG